MMKNLLILIFCVLAIAKAYPQQSPQKQDKNDIEEMIEQFFTAFHNQDVTSIQKMFHPSTRLHSVMVRNDQSQITAESMENFLNSLKSIPADVTFKEEIHEIKVIENSYTATAVTPYTFTVNGQKSHTGTNVFVLVKTDEGWKFVSIADSRIYD